MRASARASLLTVGLALLAPETGAAATAELRLDPASGGLEGRAVLDGGAPLRFRLAPGLTVSSAAVAGRQATVVRAGDGWLVATEGSGPVELRYGGRLPTDPAADPPFLGPEGGFLPEGSGWLPQAEGEPGAFEVLLDVPQPMAAVATGRRTAESTGDGRYRARFRPEPGLGGTSAFVGHFQIDKRVADGVEVRTYFHPDDAELADLYLDRAARHIAGYAAAIGPHPYAGFAIVAGPLPVGFAFPGLTYVARSILPLPFMQTRSLAHEILHGWWGNAVAVGPGGNWAEGLTTYLADHALAEAAGEGGAMRFAWARDYAALPPAADRPLTAFAGRAHDASQVLGYGKAAQVFHMLRGEIGAASFQAGLRGFYARHRYGIAGWADLEAAFAGASGRDLSAFFAQWVERPGAPRLELGAVQVTGNSLRFELRQAPPFFDLLVPVAIDTATGSVRREVRLEGAAVEAEIALAAPARRVAVDPAHDLFRALASGEATPILRDVTLDPATATLVAAPEPAAGQARELAARLLDRTTPPHKDAATVPLLVVGLTPEVERLLAAEGLPPLPPQLAGRGTARVWAAARPAAPPLLVIAADDAGSLAALIRPLPHYRRDGWLVFDGSRVVDRGTWPAGASALVRELP